MTMTMSWRVKDTLLAYMQRDPGFAVHLTGGAEFDPETGVVLPAWRDADGNVVATGSAVLSAHGGALALSLHGVVVTGEAMWITDPAESPRDPSVRIRLVTLVRTARESAGGRETYGTFLAPEADGIFLYNYVPGTPFGELEVADDARISRS